MSLWLLAQLSKLGRRLKKLEIIVRKIQAKSQSMDYQSCNVRIDHALRRDPIHELLDGVVGVGRPGYSRLAPLHHQALLTQCGTVILLAGLAHSEATGEAHDGHVLQ